MKQLTEDFFDNNFDLLDNNITGEGNIFETYGDELSYVLEMAKTNRVITIIEHDEGMCYSTGLHLVNRIGYLVTAKELTEEFEVQLEEVSEYEG